MKIGIVLSNTPAYSETFFNSKIIGLQEKEFQVTLFVSKKTSKFNLCEVKLAPKVYKKNLIRQLFLFVIVYIKLLFSIKRVFLFSKLEKKQGVGFSLILKKIYLNAHILGSNNIDWLHFGFGTLAIGRENLAKSIGAKMAVSFRGFDIGIYPLKNKDCYFLVWECVDKVHVISDDILNLCYKYGLKKTSSYQKITPAITTDNFKITNQRDFTIPNKIKFLTVGRLHWKKGYIQTLMALSILKRKRYKFTYTIVGEGNEYERIAYTAKELGILEDIQFKGKLNQIEVIEEYKKANIYLQYSIQEGFCNSVLEAQSMGLLCMVSNAEGLSENVLDNKTGWVVNKYDSNALAYKIEEVINLSTDEKKRISKAAEQHVKENFNTREQQEKFVKFYSAVCK